VIDSWSERVARARQLAQGDGPAAALLSSYADLLTLQQASFESFRKGGPPSGSLERDLPVVREQLPPLLHAIAAKGPERLAMEATELLEDLAGRAGDAGGAIDRLLLAYWNTPSDQNFFGKAALQPYASWLAESRVDPIDRAMTRADNRCPFCGGRPQLSILVAAGESDGGGRQLLCATCLTVWPFRRVVCVNCGEEDERKTGYFHTPAFDHLRLDACESCRHYLKTVDMTKLGLAVPLVDEVAGAPLDLWARERGYEKIELNLLGL
jgi:formate dehydrogenase accessory protein FdhE